MNSCTKMRRMLVKHSTVRFNSDEVTEGRSEWVTRECGSPLFRDAERVAGVCRSCASGWTHPENYPVEMGPLGPAGGKSMYDPHSGEAVEG